MSNVLNYIVYKHTSPSGKCYIGITNNYAYRSKQHQQNDSACTQFKQAIDTYGWENFTHEILYEFVTRDVAEKLEIFEIMKHNSLFPNGYNSQVDFGFCADFISSATKGDYSDFYKTKKSKQCVENKKLKVDKVEYDKFMRWCENKDDSEAVHRDIVASVIGMKANSFRVRCERSSIKHDAQCKVLIKDVKEYYLAREVIESYSH